MIDALYSETSLLQDSDDLDLTLQFACQRCGNCCRWPGFVRLGLGEAERIADFLGVEPAEFVEEFTILLPDRSSLSLKSRSDGSCVFLDDRNVCRVQPVKPLQCRGFPNAWRFPGWRKSCEAKPIIDSLK